MQPAIPIHKQFAHGYPSGLEDLRIRVGVLSSMPYAAIHEFGGKTKPHLILPRFAKALRFATALSMKGKHKATAYAFATEVHHPGSVIPARPYLMPAYESNKDKILRTFQAGLQRSLTP